VESWGGEDGSGEGGRVGSERGIGGAEGGGWGRRRGEKVVKDQVGGEKKEAAGRGR